MMFSVSGESEKIVCPKCAGEAEVDWWTQEVKCKCGYDGEEVEYDGPSGEFFGGLFK